MSLGWKLGLRPDEIDDVIQETLITVYYSKNIDLSRKSGFRTYIYKIFTCKAIDALRQKTRKKCGKQTLNMGNDDFLKKIPDRGIACYNKDLGLNDYSKVHATLNKMKSFDSDLLILLHCNSVTYRGTAEALNEPIGTIKSKRYKAANLFRKLYGDCNEN